MRSYFKTRFFYCMLLGWAVSLAGCNSINSLALYQVSEHTINQQVATQLSSLTDELRIMGIPVTLVVKQAHFTIGPDGRDVVRLAVEAQASVSMFGLRYPIILNSAFEAKPLYRQQDHSVYLQQLVILHSSVEASGYKGNLKPLDDNFQALVEQFLQANPIYTLKGRNSTEQLLMNIPLDMQIKAGLVELTPSLP